MTVMTAKAAKPAGGVPVLVGVLTFALILEVSGARKAINDKINKAIAENKQHAADSSKIVPLPVDLANAPAKHLTPDQLKLFEGAINKRLQAVTRDENKTKLESLQAKVDSGKVSWREKRKLKSLKKWKLRAS